ncbi:MAG: chemotaxis-specific protein-glutamate methyltransferase CheB [Lachnospiraceae bacterium]|nr:chemotaxis-specific protein-glutamate methyltransferase CheB [Lachnospiraceae bacterium]
MDKKRILIVDDSALMRRMESDIINSDNRFSVVGTCTNGLDTYDRVIKAPNEYDLILCDINLPKMTGLELLAALGKSKISVKVIIVSALTSMDSKETIQALQLGAFDCIKKPESFAEVMGDSFKNTVLEKVALALKEESGPIHEEATEEAAAVHKVTEHEFHYERHDDLHAGVPHIVSPMNPREILANITATKRPHRSMPATSKKLVLIASSTGGPKALQEVIPFLPKNINAPVLIVQHMAEGFTGSLAQRLDQESQIHVVEAANGDRIAKGIVYIAKGGSQMRLKKSGSDYIIELNAQEPPRNALKPCADILFESIAGMDFDDIICCVMTGMGGDGTMGINALAEKNNIYVIAQDEPTSTVYGMPKVIYESGLTDVVKPLGQLAQEIIKSTGVQDHGC